MNSKRNLDVAPERSLKRMSLAPGGGIWLLEQPDAVLFRVAEALLDLPNGFSILSGLCDNVEALGARLSPVGTDFWRVQVGRLWTRDTEFALAEAHERRGLDLGSRVPWRDVFRFFKCDMELIHILTRLEMADPRVRLLGCRIFRPGYLKPSESVLKHSLAMEEIVVEALDEDLGALTRGDDFSKVKRLRENLLTIVSRQTTGLLKLGGNLSHLADLVDATKTPTLDLRGYTLEGPRCPSGPNPFVEKVKFRGFSDAVSRGWATAFPGVTNASFSFCDPQFICRALTAMPLLTDLNVHGPGFLKDSSGAHHVEVRSVQRLSLYFSWFNPSDASYGHAICTPSFPGLKDLELFSEMDCLGPRLVGWANERLGASRHLETLSLRNFKLNCGEVDSILATTSGLVGLDLTGNQMESYADVFRYANATPTLETLFLRRNGVEDWEPDLLAFLRENKTLRSLLLNSRLEMTPAVHAALLERNSGAFPELKVWAGGKQFIAVCRDFQGEK